MFLFVGVELLRFLCGDGVPREWQKIHNHMCFTDFAYKPLTLLDQLQVIQQKGSMKWLATLT
jgi:hypothetical protein